jgi:CubicO group peptidase (beta-lactamase class C family)
MRFKFMIPFLVFGTIAIAQSKAEKLDSLFNSLYTYRQINGNVLVAENGRAIYQKSFGYLNFEEKVSHSENSIFSLASISKTFTAIAVLQLKENGKLLLDDYVIKHLKEFPYHDITIRNLLSHTSGLPDYDIFEEPINSNPNKIITNKDVLPALIAWKKPLEFKPNEKWGYSNINYNLLALIVENITGKTFQEYVGKNIFAPANMTNTYFKTDSVALRGKNKSVNYVYPTLYSSTLQNVDSLERFRWNVFNLRGIKGQGNIISTTEDMLKFDQVLYSGKLLKTSTLEEAFIPTKLTSGANADANIGIGKTSYGLGWFIFDDNTNGKIVWHTGGVPGALSILLRNIDKKQTVILLDNTASKGLYKNGVNAMNILNNKPVSTTRQTLTGIYGSTLVEKGIDIAFVKLNKLRDDSTRYYLNEDDMNDLGYQLLYEATFDRHNELALEVFKQNILLFPNSYNPYDSYGEALAKVGKKEQAILMYQKSIKINPDNEGGKKALEELLKGIEKKE